MDLQEAIPKSIATVMNGTYVYVKTDIIEKPDTHFMVSKDKDEVTVITKKENIENLKVLEIVGDYKLIEFKPAIPFQTVGFLAKIAEVIANQGMNILIVSTFSKDYIMIKEEFSEKGIKALKDAGFPIEYE
ncbi:MAG: ACT domain-containing protein [Clostridia bacterium]|nr:ACT domain-containing protein [Clostridia bacterium]